MRSIAPFEGYQVLGLLSPLLLSVFIFVVSFLSPHLMEKGGYTRAALSCLVIKEFVLLIVATRSAPRAGQ